METRNYKINRARRAAVQPPVLWAKVPPQCQEVEAAVLGAIMLEKSAFDRVSGLLSADFFYSDAHQRIFSAFIRLTNSFRAIDILTVVEELRKSNDLDIVGGPYGITVLTNAVVSTAHLEEHASIVRNKYVARQIIETGNNMIKLAFEEATDTKGLLSDVESQIFSLTNIELSKDFTPISHLAIEVAKKIDLLRDNQGELSGVPSGFPFLDRITYGWQPTDLIILAARPAVGKTAFALNIARNAATHATKPVPVAFFSLEMSAVQLVQRILAAESETPLEKINRGRLDNQEYQHLQKKGIKKLLDMPFFIDDTAALNIFEFRAKARRLVNKNKVGFIIIDYLQLMSGTGNAGNREQEISSISRNLKQLAKELHVPIIALSQLSRAVETRKESKIPQLSDLRESGAIEQDADMVMFIYRPDYYDITHNENGESTKGETHVRIAKHRNGALDTVKLHANLSIQKFYTIEESDVQNTAVRPAAHNTGNWHKVSLEDFDPNQSPF